jgi:hypothetical protein
MIGAVVYILCTVTCVVCAFQLWRGYRRTQLQLLFWSAICFFILAIANALLFVDLAVFPGVAVIVLPGLELLTVRSCLTLVALLVLLYGLIFKSN